MKFKVVDKRTTLYRKWNKDFSPFIFWDDNVYWFTNKDGLDKIKFDNELTKSYKFKEPIKLIDLDDIDTIKQLIKEASLKYKRIIRNLTGYGITERKNWLCGYKNKPKNKLMWCSVPNTKK